jgi:hypothetical protein
VLRDLQELMQVDPITGVEAFRDHQTLASSGVTLSEWLIIR